MKKRFSVIICALLVAAVASCLTSSPRTKVADASAATLTINNSVYKSVSGVQTPCARLGVLPTSSLELTIAVDVPSNGSAYLGLNKTADGNGFPAQNRTKGVGFMIYNSNNVCMALDVYGNEDWGQLTATEFLNVGVGATFTLSIRSVNGTRGIYINGELFTAKATGRKGTTAGDTINPLNYIDESDYSTDGNTYIEVGTWASGGKITVYKQDVSGSLDVLDRDGEKISGYRIDSAYDEYGGEIPLVERATLDGDDFTLSALAGNRIAALNVTTAGGYSVKAKVGESNTVAGSDYRVRVNGDGEPLDKVGFTVKNGGKDVTEHVKVTSADDIYSIEDCADELNVTVSRKGFTSKTITIPAGETGITEVELDAKPIDLTVALVDEATGKTVYGMENYVKAYRDGEEVAATITAGTTTGEYVVSGFSGKMGTHELRFVGYDGYLASKVTVDENSDGKTVKIYTSKTFTATVVTDAGATVKAGDRTFTASGSVYRLENVGGDIAVEISKAGKATRYVWLNGKNNTARITLSDEFECAVSLPVPDGTVVKWTIDGVADGRGTVTGGVVSVPHVGRGSTLTLEVNGSILKNAVYTLTGNTLAPELEESSSTELTVLYDGAAVANTTVNFGFGAMTTDENGKITLVSYGAKKFGLVSVDGFSTVDRSEISADEQSVTVNVTGKIYRARITVKNADGSAVTDAYVTLVADDEIKKTYLDGEIYESANLTKAYTVFVNGTEAGRVDENGSDLAYTIPSSETPDPAVGGNGWVVALSIAVIVVAVGAGVLFVFIRKRRGTE